MYNQIIDEKTNQLKLAVEQRKIPYLVHFTHIENTGSILDNGLWIRDELDKESIEYVENDPVRAETLKVRSLPRGICLSIAHPNDFLLEKFRKEKNLYHRNTAIFRLKPSILWEKSCVFCETNAAKSGYPLRIGADGFNTLFNPSCGGFSRTENLADYFPTNVQAEVICFDRIEPEYFLDVSWYSSDDKKIHLRTFRNGILTQNEYTTDYPFLFGARGDECLELVEEE